ncbi:PhnE/PtxC family ABC transporter permease [Heliorestis acidaminivorans]|uniref:PhnE/PtxC family ABC transporter permease n=1 Tax=Heliorestis acidaminivorans TaxID=553427 RepID=UPI001A9ABF4F|nr:ABC transporter permease subunit [Heliorestis acidaminivorans]
MGPDIFTVRRNNRIFFFLALTAITVSSIIVTEYDIAKGFTSIYKAITWSLSNFYPDANAMTRLPDIMIKLQETVLISIAATTVAALCAFFFSIFGSKTTKVNSILSTLSRGVASFSRNIPDAVWALILLFSFGQSALTGYFALFFATFGFLTRTFIETIDEVGDSSVEALRATGASYTHIIAHAYLPL